MLKPSLPTPHLLLLAGLAGFTALAGCGLEEPPSHRPLTISELGYRPNVLIVLIDTLRSDHLGSYGYDLPTSPAIDAFAAGSVRFANAHSHSTWTKPSIATLFTSLYPEQHGLSSVAFSTGEGFRTERLERDFVTLAERFRQGGYATAAFGANLHIKRKTGFAQGFRTFYSKRRASAFDLNARFTAWVDEAPREPFFGYLQYMDTHWPYDRSAEPGAERFGSTVIEPEPPKDWRRAEAWASGNLEMPVLRSLAARYDEEISFTDRAFGELVDQLGRRGILGRTLVVLLSDHGEGFGEHGELQHGYAPYVELTSVPLIVRLPAELGVTPRAIETAVGLSDVAPTLLDLLELQPIPGAAGRSLKPLLQGTVGPERGIYVEGAGARGLRKHSHSLLTLPVDDEELCFDLAADPQELTPLAEPLPPVCHELAVELAELAERLDGAAGRRTPGSDVALDPQEIEALQSLGYLQ